MQIVVKSNQIVVTWTTFNSTIRSTVCYGIESMDQVAHGSQNEFIDDGTERRKLFIHRVYLNDLNANTTYSESVFCYRFFNCNIFMSLTYRISCRIDSRME